MTQRMTLRTICGMALLTAATSALAEAAPAEQRHDEHLIPPATQLITPMAQPLPNSIDMRGAITGLWAGLDLRPWVVWPSPRDIAAHAALRDRSEEIPPVFPQTELPDPKPLVPGAKRPAAALEEAEYWIRLALAPEWLPPDLSERLIALQEDAASESSIICRFQMEGNRIQIIQRAWAMCVVIQPEKRRLENVPREDIASVLMPVFFSHGDDMAQLSGKSLAIAQPGLHAELIDSRRIPPADDGHWWVWRLWYTDGRALAILLQKYDRSARTPRPDDPWF